ncbi:siderophore-interacting protein [Mycetocola spongiae]|uniref:siderophore-interacting protein n=1 Tax=Mycetocola spongiae TaxID=2859226 RepID=UPI001CF2E89C|nr:siderophore-interacting protein [Mycetocola spongiae]UCR89850.1 siderophore-interacting protein [Mycetocola spongiae]
MSFCESARVVSVETITPHMIRIGMEPIGGWTWNTDGWGDERVDVAFPVPGETIADVAYFNQEGYGEGVLGGTEPPWRHYTVRRVENEGRLVFIDFVVHEGGLASDWASRAEPGHILGLFAEGPARAHYRREQVRDWQLLVADATGLPGLGRIVEGLAPGERAHAIIEVQTPEDRQTLVTQGDVEYTWLYGSGLGTSPSALAEAVAALPEFPEGDIYAWVACEASASRAIRKHLRRERGMSRDSHNAIGYWSDGNTGHVHGINRDEEPAVA